MITRTLKVIIAVIIGPKPYNISYTIYEWMKIFSFIHSLTEGS